MKIRPIKVDYLARVEGEGGLAVRIKDGKVVDAKFRIFEPPRFFEAFLRGRDYSEAPDITARICGICPVAYQMSSVHAMENAFGISVGKAIRELRRLIYCGEWIESHVLHVAMLHAPDFLGYDDSIQLAKVHPELVKTALRLKKAGNRIVTLVGGREIHPINVRVGGFYKSPRQKDLLQLSEELKWARDAACELTRWVAGFDFPDFERDYEYVALRHPDEYPMNEGRLASTKDLDIAIDEYDNHFVEEHVQHSTSLQSVHVERGAYHVGPLARINLNFDRLTPLVREVASQAGFTPGVGNPFKSIIARCLETLYAVEEALRIIESYEPPERPYVEIQHQESVGSGCTEAPRGILYHKYWIGDDGLIQKAKIVAPTSQNQRIIEDDLLHFIPDRLHLSQDDLTWQCEQVVRNYDPCISCSCHHLKLELIHE